jgi:hypothetical protein
VDQFTSIHETLYERYDIVGHTQRRISQFPVISNENIADVQYCEVEAPLSLGFRDDVELQKISNVSDSNSFIIQTKRQ